MFAVLLPGSGGHPGPHGHDAGGGGDLDYLPLAQVPQSSRHFRVLTFISPLSLHISKRYYCNRQVSSY
jgi:hypothetical protein